MDQLSLRESAVAMHEFYLSFLEAGFDESQALYLVGQLLRGSQGNAG